MTDYEIVRVANVGNPMAGKPYLTISCNRVGIQKETLMTIGNPEYIMICKGIRKNAGKLVIEPAGADEDGAVPINYDRKKLGFFDRNFVEMCKDLIRTYSKGEFASGTFYSVKGEKSGSALVFDFHKTTVRIVNKTGVKPGKQRKRVKKEKYAVKNDNSPLDGYEIL